MTTAAACVLGCTNSHGLPYPAAPGWVACHPCADRLAGTLGDLADRLVTLTTADELIPHSSGERGSPGFGPRSPAVDALIVHSDVRTKWTSESGYGALAVVESWARAVREETGARPPAEQLTFGRELRTIRFHWDWLMGRPWLDEFAREMREALWSLTNAGKLTERVLRVGPCPTPIDHPVGEWGAVQVWACGATLTVRADAEEIRCRECGATWPRSQWWWLGEPWARYDELSERLDVPVATLRWWCREDGWRTWREQPGAKRVLVDRQDALKSYARRRAGKVVA